MKSNCLRVIFAVSLLATCLLVSCSMQVAGGSAGEAGNAKIVGTLVDNSGNTVTGAFVYAIPSGYDPVKQSGTSGLLFSDTTGSDGNYSIPVKKRGTYNVQAMHPSNQSGMLLTGVIIDRDTMTANLSTGTLYMPGAARIALPDTVDTANGYVYVPGAFYSEELSKEQLITDNNRLHLVFDSLPANMIPCINYDNELSPISPVCITDTITIITGDTVNINANLEWTVYSPANCPIPDYTILSVMVDNEVVKWVGTKNSGFATFDDVNWTIKNTGNSLLPHNTVSAFAREKNGIVWVGTYGGLVKIEQRNWTIYTSADSTLPNDTITTIAVDSLGVMWFGTPGGCVEHDGQTWKPYTNGSSTFDNNHINAIAVSSINTKYIGTDSGLVSYNGSMWASIDSLQPRTIRGIACKSDTVNTTWVVSPIGISHSTATGVWNLLNSANSGFPNESFLSIATDNNNIIWAGSEAEGNIVMIKPTTDMEIYNAQNTDVLINCGAINCITVDGDNNIYFGTDNTGLVMLRIIPR
jgi:ligand-binding sensor domain-containing protein